MQEAESEKSRLPVEPGQEQLLTGVSLVIPLVIGCAIVGVAVLIGYTFARKQEESFSRKQAAKARVALRRSLEAMKKRDYVASETAATTAINLAESITYTGGLSDSDLKSTAYLFRAEARSGRGTRESLEAACEDYTRCLHLNPDQDNRFMAFYGRGQVLYRLGDFEGAEKNFTDALAINRYSATVYGARALARRKLGKTGKAGQDEKRALELGE